MSKFGAILLICACQLTPKSDSIPCDAAAKQKKADESRMWVAPGRGEKAIVPFRRANRWGYLDNKGRVAIEPHYQNAGRFRYGRAFADKTIIDQNNELVVGLPANCDQVILSERSFWFCTGNKWGLMDYAGSLLISETYDEVRRFSEGLAAVNRGARWEFPGIQVGGRWGYVDETGSETITVKYAKAGEFHFGRAVVETHLSAIPDDFLPRTRSDAIDPNDTRIFPISGYAHGHFADGLLAVESEQWTTYFDLNGKPKFEIFGSGDQFHNGVAARRTADFGAINTTGKVVFQSDWEVGPLCCNRASITHGDREFGFVDESGVLTIPQVYNEVNDFEDGVAVVHRDGKLNELCDAPFYWTGGIWVLIDVAGNELAAIEMDEPTQPEGKIEVPPRKSPVDPNFDD